ncbi:hypothetical protein F4818DRAFT_408842 [Hypoxylon cercidicola]|nr:hypothetical protein F4818DRAFT_408842 [Hypoxylon cercidicola]
MHFWTMWACVDSGVWQPEQQTATAGSEGDQAVFFSFRRWQSKYIGPPPEWEEASARRPLARESLARTVAKVTPPVTAWEHRRWDVQWMPAPRRGRVGRGGGLRVRTEFERIP